MWVTAFLLSFLLTFEPLRNLVPFSKQIHSGSLQMEHFVTLVTKNRTLYNPYVLLARKLFYYES